MNQTNRVNSPEETQHILCPVCRNRLFDVLSSCKEVRLSRQNGAMRIKCHKCKQQIGIKIEM